MRYLSTDDDLSMRGHTLQEAISRDKEDGLIPFYVSFNHQKFVFLKVELWIFKTKKVPLTELKE